MAAGSSSGSGRECVSRFLCQLRSGDKVPITNVDDYIEAMRRLSAWFDDPPEYGTDEGNAFETLLMRVAVYESEQFPI